MNADFKLQLIEKITRAWHPDTLAMVNFVLDGQMTMANSLYIKLFTADEDVIIAIKKLLAEPIAPERRYDESSITDIYAKEAAEEVVGSAYAPVQNDKPKPINKDGRERKPRISRQMYEAYKITKLRDSGALPNTKKFIIHNMILRSETCSEAFERLEYFDGAKLFVTPTDISNAVADGLISIERMS